MFDNPRVWTDGCDIDNDVAKAAHHLECARLWEEVVRVLTSAARLRHPTDGRIDFADFLASALGAVAANVSGPDELLAGRSGSWEAAHIADLLAGVVGDDPERLLRLRTEPIVVPLNVDQLVSDAFFGASLAEQESRLPDLMTAEEETANQFPEVAEAEIDAQLEALPREYALAYERYADRFRKALAGVVAAELGGVDVEVTVEATTEPDTRWWERGSICNPDPDGDALVWRLWSAAREQAGWPVLESP